MLSLNDHDKIRKERNMKGEPGGSKRGISEMNTKLRTTTATISSLTAASSTSDDSVRDLSSTSKNQIKQAIPTIDGEARATNELWYYIILTKDQSFCPMQT